MDTLSKPKHQSSNSELMGTNEFTFTSSYSMDECINHLNALKGKYQNERSIWQGSRLSFVSLTDNGGVVQFEIAATRTKQMIDARLVGQLIHKDYNKTLVRMQIGATRQSVVLHLIINAIICLAFTMVNMTVAAFVSALCLYAIIHVIAYIVFLRLKSELHESAHEALRKPRAPRPDTLPL